MPLSMAVSVDAGDRDVAEHRAVPIDDGERIAGAGGPILRRPRNQCSAAAPDVIAGPMPGTANAASTAVASPGDHRRSRNPAPVSTVVRIWPFRIAGSSPHRPCARRL